MQRDIGSGRTSHLTGASGAAIHPDHTAHDSASHFESRPLTSFASTTRATRVGAVDQVAYV